MTERRELGVLHGRFRFVSGIDVRHLDPSRTTIERARDRGRIIALDANHRAVPGELGRADHVFEVFPAARAVFAVEKHAVEALMAQQLDQSGRRRKRGDDGRRLAGRELLFQ